jgi:sn-glycerol 3-phosphate transport system permease protein
VIRPVLASFTVLAFLTAWNQYTWPRAIVNEGRSETLQIGLKALTTNPETGNVGVAAALLAALPVLLLLLFFQRHLIRGLTAGAVKG